MVGFEIDGIGRVGLAVCHDGVFPEVFRQLTWDGAEAIIQVSLTRTSDRDAEIVVARANAIVNQVYLVNLNAAAPVGNGRSVVVDPEGIVWYEAGAGEEVVTAVARLRFGRARPRARRASGSTGCSSSSTGTAASSTCRCTAGATGPRSRPA